MCGKVRRESIGGHVCTEDNSVLIRSDSTWFDSIPSRFWKRERLCSHELIQNVLYSVDFLAFISPNKYIVFIGRSNREFDLFFVFMNMYVIIFYVLHFWPKIKGSILSINFIWMIHIACAHLSYHIRFFPSRSLRYILY